MKIHVIKDMKKDKRKDMKSELTRNRLFQPVLFILLALIVIGCIVSASVGSTMLKIPVVFSAFFAENATREQMLVTNLRIPRTLVALLVGASLAVAGAVIQAMTRNTLASPQVFGLTSGASLVTVLTVIFVPSIGSTGSMVAAFIGAVLGGVVVYILSASTGMTPVKLALAGMTIHLLLSSMTQGLLIFNEQASDVLFWLAGAIDSSSWGDVSLILPWIIVGLILAMILGPALTIFNLGDNIAKALGQRIGVIRLISAVVVIILAGSAVSVAGGLGFIGLMVPNMMRWITGDNYKRLIPLSALAGATLLLYADVGSRFIAYPYESPVGIVTALLGAPFFLILAYQRGRNNS